MLQVFESDSKTCNIVARILLVLVRVTHLPLTFNATSSQNARGEPKIGHVDVKKTNKMAELVEDEGLVEITIPEKAKTHTVL